MNGRLQITATGYLSCHRASFINEQAKDAYFQDFKGKKFKAREAYFG
jgi:hypothetical protein